MNSEHAARWKSAAIMLAVIALVGILDIKFLTWLFFALVLYFAIDESCKLWGAKFEEAIVVAAATWLVALFFPSPYMLIFILLLVLAAKLAYDKKLDKRLFLVSLYPLAGILFIWSLYVEWGMKALLWLLIIVAFSDVGAYYVGKKFGKTPFSPTSPKKTLEGVFGGVALASIIGAIFISSSNFNFFIALLIAMLSSISSVFGDLFESYLKREAGVKDSGNLIPGHGGILDRIDGYLFASVTLYILLELSK